MSAAVQETVVERDERSAIADWIDETFGDETEVLLADGLEAAFVGIGQQFNSAPAAVYDAELCIGVFMDRDGMSHEEATEFFEFNVAGAYVGPSTPIFIVRRPVADVP